MFDREQKHALNGSIRDDVLTEISRQASRRNPSHISNRKDIPVDVTLQVDDGDELYADPEDVERYISWLIYDDVRTSRHVG